MRKKIIDIKLGKYKKPLVISLVSIFVLFLIGIAIAFNKRQSLLDAAIAKAIKKAKTDYDLNVKINSYGFSGLSKIYFQSVSIVPDQKDTLATIKNLEVGVKLLSLIFGSVKISELDIHDALVSLIKKDSISN